MNGIYPKILRQAFRLTKSNRVFWKAGLLLAWPNLLRALIILSLVAGWLARDQVATGQGQVMEQGNPWIGLAVMFLIGLALLFYFRAKAVVILAAKQLQAKPQVDQLKLSKEVEPHVSGFLRFGMSAGLVLVLVMAFLYSPVLYLDSNGLAARADILGALATLIFFPVLALAYCVMVFGPMFMAAHSLTPTDSVRASVDMFRTNWLFVLVFWLALFAVELAGIAVSVALFVAAAVPFVLLGQIFYDGGGQELPIALQAVAGIACFMVFFTSQAMVAAFQRVAWAVAFLEIVKPVKMEEQEEPETVPEVIS